MTWTSIFIAGLLTYFTRMSMVTLIRKEMISDNLRKILNYVPSVVFPSIIFPGVLLDDFGAFVTISDPKIFGAITALVIGVFYKECYFNNCIGAIFILDCYFCFLIR